MNGITVSSLRLFVFLILTLVFSIPESAQSQPKTRADYEARRLELQQQLPNFERGSDAFIDAKVELVRITWLHYPDECIEHGQEVLPLLRQQQRYSQLVYMLGYLPRVYIARSNYDEAMRLIDIGVDAGKQVDEPKRLATVLYNRGTVYAETGRFLLATEVFKETLAIYKALQIPRSIGNNLNNLGWAAHLAGDLAGSLAYYLEALPIVEEHATQADFANTLSNAAEIYTELEDYEQAQRLLDRANAIIENSGDPQRIIEILLKRGDNLQAMNRWDESLQNYNRAQSMAESEGFKKLIGYALLGKSQLFNRQNQYQVALDMLLAGESLAEAIAAESLQMHIANQMANTYMGLKQYEKAELNLLLAVQLAEKNGDTSNASEMKKKLSELASLNEDYRRANHYLLEYQQGYQEKVQKEKDGKIEQLQEMLRLNERERTIADLQQKNTASQLQAAQARVNAQRWAGGLIVAVLVLGAIAYRNYQRRRMLGMKTALMTEMVERKNQLLADVSHELRTPLSALKLQVEGLEYELEDDRDSAFQALHRKIGEINRLIADIYQLSQADISALELQRESIDLIPWFRHWSNETGILLRQNQLRLNLIEECSQFVLDCDIDRIAQVFNNLAANVIRYADKPGQVQLTLRGNKHELLCRFEDSGPGLSEQERHRIFERLYRVERSRSREFGGSGLGLSICKSLVEAHGGSIRADDSDLGGLCIEVRLPCGKTENPKS